MFWTEVIIPGSIVWFIQLILSDFLAINNVRPDFIVILILYWSVQNGRFFGVISGTLLGFIVDLTGTANFFGLSPLIYSITGYLSGNLYGKYKNLNPLYFSFAWIAVILFQFLLFCAVQYQEIWIVNKELFLGKWFGTSIYTLAFLGIIQFIYPLNKLD